MENQHSARIKKFQSDDGAKFTSNCFKAHLRTSGIHHHLSCTYTPAQNGRAERKNHLVIETGLALLFYFHTFPCLLVDVFSIAAYIINRLPAPLLGSKSPFELLYGSSPNYENFHPFGCRVYPCLHDYMPNKFSPRSIPCIFWVTTPLIKGFVVLILPLLGYISPAMLNLMRLTFPFSLPLRLNPYPPSNSQII